MLGIMLLNHMGPIGQEIHRTFVFYDTEPMEDLSVLIKKFDIYCIYGDEKRDCEDIDKYINDLKSIAIAMNCVDPTLVVKEKIIQDICAQLFTGIVTFLQEYKGKLIPHLRSLELDDIILFCKQSEMAQNMEEPPRQDFHYAKSTALECIRCGTVHKRNQCPAWGVQCNRCKQFNHFTENCKFMYIDNCTKCGTSHVLTHCPAYGELCTKYGKRYHFASKCQIPFMNNCWRCGASYVATMCPAQGRTCRYCNKLNHLEERCASRCKNGQ
ncbi:PREDICTED: uncharacterized protein LOC105564090 [Vollenhovia emeryi]|uniref:uncharacterized protein LOC105564090 n=1 Tax=Vollenhovia emeryi TaxID=411798 RepID=UPI0005F54939|nr:PREDICTED: uncharacterized protein LOC105564090 [Vollenhovia emeryi]